MLLTVFCGNSSCHNRWWRPAVETESCAYAAESQ